MIDLIIATAAFTCGESRELIDSINQYATAEVYRQELIETIKENTEPKCYEGSEPSS
tara:strand:+ start:112 stop:282 length:171 start_codon:yes stop_codon:yes gene_type:complete